MDSKQMRRDIAGLLDRWREWQKVLVSLIVMGALCLVVYFFSVPNPNMILITGLVVFTSMFGYPSGIVSAVIMVGYSMFFFSTDHSFFAYTEINGQKLCVIILGVVLTLCFVGQLKTRHSALVTELREMNKMLADENRILEQATTVDSLTGLRNRFALRRDYPGYDGQNLCVMMMDVDDFKAVNDSYGHGAGDHVLIAVAGALRAVFGDEGCYRFGGDEFLVVLRSGNIRDFESRIAELQRRILSCAAVEDGWHVSCSGGYVYGRAEYPGDLRLMIRHADRRLYDAKAQGKRSFNGARFHRSYAEQLTSYSA